VFEIVKESFEEGKNAIRKWKKCNEEKLDGF
jgi:hypothetical protein